MNSSTVPVPYRPLPGEDRLDVVYRGAFSVVVRVPDFGTARLLGEGSGWSVLSDRKAFDDIRRRGPLLLVFDRTTGERYWLCFERCLFVDDEGEMAPLGTLCRLFPTARLFAPTEATWHWLVCAWWHFGAYLHPALVLDVVASPTTPISRHLLAHLVWDSGHDTFREFAALLSDTTFPEELFAVDLSPRAVRFASRVARFLPPHRAVSVLDSVADALARIDYEIHPDMDEAVETVFAVAFLCGRVYEQVDGELLRRVFRALSRAPLGPGVVLCSLALLDPLPERLAHEALSIDAVRAELDYKARDPKSLARHYGPLVPFVNWRPRSPEARA